MKAAEWPVIFDYCRKRDPADFGIHGVQVTHAWTQFPKITEKICSASLIKNPVKDYTDMIGAVDGILIARDDYETHFEMAMPFLKAGVPVYVDKPLTLVPEQLKTLTPYLESGLLMSCAALRYAVEIDEARRDIKEYGELKLIRGAVVKCWEKYGVHMIDATLGLLPPEIALAFESIHVTKAQHMSAHLRFKNGPLVQIDSLGSVPKTFRLDIYGEKRRSHHDLEDNFSMFKRTLWHFVDSIRNQKPAFDPELTLTSMRILMAGNLSLKLGREVFAREIEA